MQHVFTAVFTKDEDKSLLVSFPDLPECCAKGANMLDAAKKAKAILTLCLFDMEQRGIAIPKARYPDEITTKDGEVVSMVVADTDPYHLRFGKDTTKHTFYMPSWFGQVAKASNLDLSRLLQNAVRQEIGIPIRKVDGNKARSSSTKVSEKSAFIQEVLTNQMDTLEKTFDNTLEKTFDKPKKESGGRKFATVIMVGLVVILILAVVFLVILIFTDWLSNIPVVNTFVEYVEARTPINFNNYD